MSNVIVEGLMFFFAVFAIILVIPLLDCITIFMRMEFNRRNERKKDE